MKTHKVRQVLASSRGEVWQIGQQEARQQFTQGLLKPLGSALLHGLLIKSKAPTDLAGSVKPGAV